MKAANGGGTMETPKKYPVLGGTFLSDAVFQNWTDAEWRREFEAYREIGLQYLVMTSNVVRRKDGSCGVCYPTRLPGLREGYAGRDLIGTLLRYAREFGMKVFMGLNFDDRWWDYFWDTDYTTANRAWLYDQMKLGNQIADELYERYHGEFPDAFYGWYWIWEFWNSTVMTLGARGRRQNIRIFADCLNSSLRHFTELDPSMPMLLSPYVNFKLGTTRQDLCAMWRDILADAEFRNGDILCPQDSVGAGGASLAQLPDFYGAFREAADTKPGLRLWANNENFVISDWSGSCLDRFVKQMELSDPYVERHLTYAYPCFYSPVNAHPGYHDAYKRYYETGKLPCAIPRPPVRVAAEIKGKHAVVRWDFEGDLSALAGFDVYRDNGYIGGTRWKQRGGKENLPDLECCFDDDRFSEVRGENPVEYAVTAVDFDGNNSVRVRCRCGGDEYPPSGNAGK